LIKEKEVKAQLFPSCGHVWLQHLSAPPADVHVLLARRAPFLSTYWFISIKRSKKTTFRQQKTSAQSWHIRIHFWCGCFQKLILKAESECKVKNNTDTPLLATF
jgi:hypothetical protein